MLLAAWESHGDVGERARTPRPLAPLAPCTPYRTADAFGSQSPRAAWPATNRLPGSPVLLGAGETSGCNGVRSDLLRIGGKPSARSSNGSAGVLFRKQGR